MIARGYVYAIRSGDFIKVGYSARPVQRTQDLGTGAPIKPELLGFIEGGINLERDLHKTFSVHHHRAEWFRAEGAVLEFVKTLKRPRDWLFKPDRRYGKRSPERCAELRASKKANLVRHRLFWSARAAAPKASAA